MRILMTIHHQLDPDSGAPGGTYQLAKEYRDCGHEVDVLDFGRLLPGGLPEQAKMIAFPWAVAAWRARLRAFDVIDASTGDGWVLGVLRRLVQYRRRLPLLVTRSWGLEHRMDASRRTEAIAALAPLSWKYRLYHGGYRLWEVAQSLRRADLVLLLNKADRDYAIQRLGVASHRTVVVRAGIAAGLLRLPPPQAGVADGGRIAVIGSYIPRKGIAYAARALSIWLPRNPSWAVSFLGTGAPEEEVLADYEPMLRDRISVVPRYANADLPRLLEGHQIHLFPTLAEGWGMAVVEAMACGLAPIVSAVPGPLDIVQDGRDALVVPPGDPGAITQALDRLTADRRLLHRIRREAHNNAQAYGWREVAAEQLRVYEEQMSTPERLTHRTER